MVRLEFVVLLVLIASCFAAPGQRVKRHGYDYGHGGYGGGYGGYGHHGIAGGYGYGGAHIPISQSYSKSSASASSVGTSLVG